VWQRSAQGHSRRENGDLVSCPGCGVEIPELEGAEQQEPLRVCAACGGMTVELADLSPILLHNDLPGMEALGGRVVPDGEVGECPSCHVDLTLFEGGERSDPQFYEVCEECGRVFIAGASLDPTLAPEPRVVSFFRRFAAKRVRPR
jgi:Zn-finger nucleic acid-binding protein